MLAPLTKQAAVTLMRTADYVKRAVCPVVEPHGITLQQFNVLRILRGAGPEGLPTLVIAERMIEQTPGITRLIDRLETKALVQRKRCPTDRRQVFCIITKSGLSLLARLDVPIRKAEEAALRALSSRQLEQLLSLLNRAMSTQNEEAS